MTEEERRARSHRRMTLFYAAIVAGIVTILIARFFDVASFNTVRDYQASSCVQRASNVKKSGRNTEAIRRIGRNLRIYLQSAADGRKDAAQLQLATDPKQAVINLDLAHLWGDQLDPAVGRAIDLLADLQAPRCETVPPRKGYLPFDVTG